MITYSSRNDVPEIEKWKLEDIYNSQKDWEADVKEIEKIAEMLRSYDGKIHDGGTLLSYLTESEKLSFMFGKVSAYAMLQVDIDTRESSAQSLQDRAKQLGVKISSSTAFFYAISIESR